MTHDEMIAVIQAHKEGKTIQFCTKNGEWVDTRDNSPLWDFSVNNYRIKPEPHYRPFKSAEEVMEAIKEHGLILRYKSHSAYYIVISVWNDNKIWFASIEEGRIYEDMMNDYTFADGTPFGKLEE